MLLIPTGPCPRYRGALERHGKEHGDVCRSSQTHQDIHFPAEARLSEHPAVEEQDGHFGQVGAGAIEELAEPEPLTRVSNTAAHVVGTCVRKSENRSARSQRPKGLCRHRISSL